ncbi:MAG TPA: protein kinase [Thermoanaerobaculia bacterium]|nr:protein kinase [Thermoanaerobaculia bacterium]
MIGTRVSNFEILERLGGGGMGVVYKARDLRLDRVVALKFLTARRDGSEGDHQRFLREARAAATLDHPGVCAIHEIGETEDGALFLVMAFCEGESLARVIDSGPLRPAQAAHLAAQIADGLAAAHERGIVHRDIKPANVLVTPGGDAGGHPGGHPGGQIKIVDFGVARLAGVTRITRPGTTVGTAAYMAPEQLRGEEVDARADVWSLGVVLYEMLTGELPFPGANESEIISGILHAHPRPIGAFRDGVPAGLEHIALRALAKRPADRYARIADMARELRDFEEAATSVEGTEHTLVALSRSRSGPLPASGLRLGSLERYRVLGPLGGGAMGVVHEAEDTALGRRVALKFLPAELSRDPDSKERFLREARAASALDHPNVCTIHEIGETGDGRLFLAMARYEGETLKRRLERGSVSLEEALDIVRQIAHGLAKAHRQGIVHRDIKPANLMLTGDGVVKILDFGIAKLAGEAGLTRLGTPMGTPAYMSPEQARGDEVGPASDVWSMGAVVYEMLAGRRLFPADNEHAVLYAILHEEPKPLRALRPDVPPELERIVARMLARDPAARYPSAVEAHAEIKALYGPTTSWTVSGVASKEGRWGRWARRLPWMAATLAAGLAAAAYLLPERGRTDAPVQGTFTRLTDQEGSEELPSLSPDGSFFLYTKEEDGNADVYLQRVGGGNPINLTADSPADDTQAVFSPDGQQIAFRSDRDGGGIFLMGATGESARRLTDFGYNPAWSPDGREILVATEGVSGANVRLSRSEIWRVDAATGARRLLVRGDAVQPSWSPSGRRVAYWGLPAGSGQRVIWTVAADPEKDGAAEPVPVTGDTFLNWNPVWAPDGRHLYYASDRGGSMNLWRVRVDEGSGEVRGAPEPVTTPAPWSGFLSFSRDGKRIVYATRDGRSNLERAPLTDGRAGPLEPVTRGTRTVRSAAVSPDGQWLAFDTSAPQEDLFVVRADGSGQRQLTDDVFKDRSPSWSPRGDRILFYSNRSGRYEAWTIRPDGSGLEQLTRTTGRSLTNPSWSPDGRWLACTLGERGALIDLSKPVAERVPRPLPPVSPAGEVFSPSSWSPDGTALLGYVERPDESPVPGIYLYRLVDGHEGREGRYERLTAGGARAGWLDGGRSVLFSDQGRIFAVDLQSHQVRLVAEPPPHSAFTMASASPDGRALYVVRATDEGDVWRLDLQ